MTYREKYQQLHPEEDVSRIHLQGCPNARMDDLPDFQCPFNPCAVGPDVDGPGPCFDCWDTEIPGMEEEPPASEKPVEDKPTARILIEVIGDTIHMEADGDMEDLILSVLSPTSDNFRLSPESKLAAEKIYHGIQKVFNPLAWIRDLGKEDRL